ncbi:Polysaccharide pyruvyl transferase [Pseudovibrio axinellae]|uniref:Polysaccharide pyruvyl transferase n=1 Tax=Pseudovibrio axinellae TaxID=989403 RepID=A0A165W2E2_9HYPH|nr:polysaccharide pyruvyl transferase family protein [Pseudovibrio axinellae]KZL15864.1 Polysaccharide pyruvyl transferase [Pseudovibrio axinellae]SER82940.1 Polysaccharide pyruvyl transferase [Pseudovibrio axinellae]
MELRTFYWQGRIIPKWKHSLKKIRRRNPSGFFTIGNCGDIFNRELIKHLYGKDIAINNLNEGKNRLLLVGSISHTLQDGDWLCGTGTKFEEVPARKNDVILKGLRGPICYEMFKKAGYDLSNLEFLYDPGLLISELIPNALITEAKPSGAIFIPHYRERFNLLPLPKEIRFCDIDCTPRSLAEQILGAELVYASSLHGIIFAHALGRPAVFVQPQTIEPELKFRDYYASVGLPFQKPIADIGEANLIRDEKVPYDINFRPGDIKFPKVDELIKSGVITK